MRAVCPKLVKNVKSFLRDSSVTGNPCRRRCYKEERDRLLAQYAVPALFAFHEEGEFVVVFALADQRIAGLLRECLEITH